MTRGMHVRAGLVDLGVDGEGSCINRFVADHYIAVFVHEDEIRDTDLREVLRECV